jgi:hypothetical protein
MREQVPVCGFHKCLSQKPKFWNSLRYYFSMLPDLFARFVIKQRIADEFPRPLDKTGNK